jgi:hypothetical protein
MRRSGTLSVAAAIYLVGSAIVASPAINAEEGDQPALPPAELTECSDTGLPPLSSGDEARAELKDTGLMKEVAADAGVESRDLRRALKNDDSLKVNECGNLLYLDPLPSRDALAQHEEHEEHPEHGTKAALPQHAANLSIGENQNVFALNSRPGASTTIYLDFDGGPTPESWKRTHQKAYGIELPDTAAPFGDSDPAFSAEELEAIRLIWEGVAEDYSPFDVNVTTQQPPLEDLERSSTADTRYGATALVTPLVGPWAACRCDGIAWMGVFNDTGSDPDGYKVTLNNGTAKYIEYPDWAADTITHEMGHTLGLVHDRTADHPYAPPRGAWSTIMGSTYGGSISQFSNGDFPGSLNDQDDLRTISLVGPQRLADDHADTPGSATAIGSSAPGLITTREDVDWFTFTARDTQTGIYATPRARYPNVNLELHVTDASGRAIVTDNPAATNGNTNLGAAATITTTPGQAYFIRVDGTGENAAPTIYSDYGSLGQYTVSVSGAVSPPDSDSPPTTPEDPQPQAIAPIITTGKIKGAYRGPRERKRWYVWATWEVSPDTIAPSSYKVVLKGKKTKAQKKKEKRGGQPRQYPTRKSIRDASRGTVAAFPTVGLQKRGRYLMTITAKNRFGTSEKYKMSIKAKRTRGKAVKYRVSELG